MLLRPPYVCCRRFAYNTTAILYSTRKVLFVVVRRGGDREEKRLCGVCT